jgi:hypothetical protein
MHLFNLLALSLILLVTLAKPSVVRHFWQFKHPL